MQGIRDQFQKSNGSIRYRSDARSFDNMVRYIVLEYALWLRNDYGIPEDDQMFWNNLESNLLDAF